MSPMLKLLVNFLPLGIRAVAFYFVSEIMTFFAKYSRYVAH